MNARATARAGNNGKLTYGEHIGASALDKRGGARGAGAGASGSPTWERVRSVIYPHGAWIGGVRHEGPVTVWHAYVTRTSRLNASFGARVEAEAALARYDSERRSRRERMAQRRKVSQIVIVKRPGSGAEGAAGVAGVAADTWIVSHAKYQLSRPVLAGPFATAAEARAYAREHLEELLAWTPPADPTRTPVPVDLTGAAIDPAVLLERFSLRGLEFGVWERARIGALAKITGDALALLARVLGVSERAIGLRRGEGGGERGGGDGDGGSLALALGARGHGRAAAHYEPARNVINLTKPGGAGALAHEWGHALEAWVRCNPRSTEIGLGAVYCAINECPEYLAAARLQDEARGKPYWSRGDELLARSFESWVAAKTHSGCEGASARFLVSLEGYEAIMPQGEELARVCAAWEGAAARIARVVR